MHLSDNRKWWTLAGVTFAIFMTTLDNTVVNVALPSIQRDLGLDRNGLEWIVNAYILAFATLLLTGGRLADVFGRRRLFLTGLALFTGASLFGGFASSAATLVAARAAQGAGAALLAPTTLAIIAAAFPLETERAKAIGIWAATSALAFAAGPVTGGAIAQHVHWSWIFWINVPVGLVGSLIARAAIDESRDPDATRRIDVAGLVSSGAALLVLVYALIAGNEQGWSSPLILGLLTLATLLFTAFLAIERRSAAPMLDLSLFRDRTFTSANALQVLSGFGIFGVYFFLSLYVQGILGFSATKAGLVFVPMALVITVLAPASQKLVGRLGVGATVALGMLVSAVGLVLLQRVGQSAGLGQLVPGVLLVGGGAGLTTPLTAAVLARVSVAKSGVASGVLNTTRELAATLGIAVTGAILAARESAALGGGAAHAAAFVDGYQVGLLVSAAVMAAGAVLALVALRPERAATTPLSPVPEVTRA
jgi:EmrB/QacA subfamily drug resistance transporter